MVAAVCRRINNAGLFGIHVYAGTNRDSSWDEINRTKLYGKEMSLTALPDGSLFLTVESKAFVEDPTQMATLNEPPEALGAERNVCEVVRWRLPEAQ